MFSLTYFYTALYLLLLVSCFADTCSSGRYHEHKNKVIKGMFIFGTSIVDNGNNNNNLNTTGKANYLPYGIDFPFGTTGRFSNGKNVADCVGDLLGLPLPPPFEDPLTRGDRILHGVNYGCGGSGILDHTSVEVMSLNEQIRKFEEVTLVNLQEHLGSKSAQILNGYLFLVAAGDNDFWINFPLQNQSSWPTVPDFVLNLTSTYSSQLQKLYKVGARKFVLLTVYPLGCTPVAKQIVSDGKECVEMFNQVIHYFNYHLIKMVDDLNLKLPGSNFIVLNTYNIILDIIKNPFKQGFTNWTDPCCELKNKVVCKEGGNVCAERHKYVFFDGHHYSEAVDAVIANKAFSSKLKTDVYPFNLQTLIKYYTPPLVQTTTTTASQCESG